MQCDRQLAADRMCSVYASWGWACYTGRVYAACMVRIPAGWPHLLVALPAAGWTGQAAFYALAASE